jgi:predicted ATP-grasp superfamily ATP-dependent carboligase
MRVFVYEFISGGAREGTPPPSLRAEGWAMLAAVLEDFGRCPGVETVTLLDPQLASRLSSLPSVTSHFSTPANEESVFRALAAGADLSLVIAPEFDDILAHRCRWVEEGRGRLLGPSAALVRRTADKWALARHWKAHGIPTPATDRLGDEADTPFYPLVCKPRYGAGSQATYLVHSEEELARALREDGGASLKERILQPFLRGLPVSVAFLAAAEGLFTLPATKQLLSADGRFQYLGGRVPLTEDQEWRARRLAERAVRCVEGLQGYFGVDLILGDQSDGSADVVIEINPRLTTSYVGLRRLAKFNLAEALLAVAAGSPPPAWEWREETIVFSADDSIKGANRSLISPE